MSTTWSTSSGNYNPHYFLIEFNKPVIVQKYDITGMVSWGQAYSFILQASNDKENWINLENEIHEPGLSSSVRTFKDIEVNNEKPYKYYRIYMPTGGWTWGSSGGAAIYELQLYGM